MATSILASNAAIREVIELGAPDKSRGATLMKALDDRKSTRAFDDKDLSMNDLSDLLWAANGINRPETGMRTAASAMNRQDIDIYVVLQEATYLYDAKGHRLVLVAEGDFRKLVAVGQEFVNQAPLSLVLVSELARFNNPDDQGTRVTAAIDAGIVSGNISLFCSAVGLATVPRTSMNGSAMKEAWSLAPTQIPLVNHPVGYFK